MLVFHIPERKVIFIIFNYFFIIFLYFVFIFPHFSLKKAAQVDLESLKNIVVQHTRGLQEVQLGQFKALEQVQTIASLTGLFGP